MGSDIRLDVGFCDHFKTRELADIAGEVAVVCLLRLWCWAGSNRPNGDLSGLSGRNIERMAGWLGAEGKLIEALTACRFLDGQKLHDWAEHQPWVTNSKARSEAAREAAKKRWSASAPKKAPAQKAPAKVSRFTPPTLEEVKAYCDERQNGIDPQAFIDFYQSKGWMVGKTKMKNWQACVRTWEQKRAADKRPGQGDVAW